MLGFWIKTVCNLLKSVNKFFFYFFFFMLKNGMIIKR